MLELIITFAVVGIGLGASLTLLLTSGVQNRRTELDAIAENLAREGVEVIRAIRDSNWLARQRFDTGLYFPANGDTDGTFVFNPATGGWAMDFSAAAWLGTDPQFPAPAATVYEDSNVYKQTVAGGPGATTQFQRVFRITSLCRAPGIIPFPDATCGGTWPANLNSKAGVVASVYVQWTDRGKTYSTSLETHLYDWKL